MLTTRASGLIRIGLLAACGFTSVAPAYAQSSLPPISIGAGMRSSFVHTQLDDDTLSDDDDSADQFLLDSARLYVSGSVTDKIKMMFNTEYNGSSNDVEVLDAAGQFAFSPKFNVWLGRFLPPSDRANLYGPYYAHHWGVFSDGVQDGYPFIFQGRANGAMYWGQFGKVVKLSGGAFDGDSLDGDDTVMVAGRAQFDFWDAEDGYYLNGTYYGDKNLLAIGVAGQAQGEDKSAYSVDFLLERKAKGGAFTFEAEWAKYDRLGGYDANYGTDDGGYILGAYLFPKSGGGQWELLGKWGKARFREGVTEFDPDYDQTTGEFNVNYVIKQFNARVMMFYKDTRFDAVRIDSKQLGVGMQLQL